MAYWKEDKIAEWEIDYIGYSPEFEQYAGLSEKEPGLFLLLLHIWNDKKWEHDRNWVDQPFINEDGKRDYIGKRTYDGITRKVRVKGFAKKETEYNEMINEIEENSLKSFENNKGDINE